MSQGKYLFTSESVSMGHPDKLADQISDGVLDAYLAQDPRSRVACETMVTTGLAVIAGEITSRGTIDYQQVVRNVIREVGYTDDEMGIAAVPHHQPSSPVVSTSSVRTEADAGSASSRLRRCQGIPRPSSMAAISAARST